VARIVLLVIDGRGVVVALLAILVVVEAVDDFVVTPVTSAVLLPQPLLSSIPV
jgi:hypothetical protein